MVLKGKKLLLFYFYLAFKEIWKAVWVVQHNVYKNNSILIIPLRNDDEKQIFRNKTFLVVDLMENGFLIKINRKKSFWKIMILHFRNKRKILFQF